MDDFDRYMANLRNHVGGLIQDTVIPLALAPRLDDRPLQVALSGPEKAFVRTGMRATGAEKGFDRTVTSMTGGEFAPGDVKALEDRLLDKAQWPDVGTLTGVVEGPPVYLRPDQKAVVDRLIGSLGSDPLAQRAQTAYQRAIGAGQVRTH